MAKKEFDFDEVLSYLEKLPFNKFKEVGYLDCCLEYDYKLFFPQRNAECFRKGLWLYWYK